VKKEEEYRKNADECRRLASLMKAGAQRDQLLQIAAIWQKLAEERTVRSIPPDLRRLSISSA
jgi:hypothetical protein